MIGVTRRREENGVDAGRRCDTDGREELFQERRARALPARHLDGWTRALSSLAGLASPRARALSYPGYKTRIFEPSKQYNVVVVLRGCRLLIVVAVVAITPPANYLLSSAHPLSRAKIRFLSRLSGPQGLCSLGRSRHLCRHRQARPDPRVRPPSFRVLLCVPVLGRVRVRNDRIGTFTDQSLELFPLDRAVSSSTVRLAMPRMPFASSTAPTSWVPSSRSRPTCVPFSHTLSRRSHSSLTRSINLCFSLSLSAGPPGFSWWW
jgi:hypothetical protein